MSDQQKCAACKGSGVKEKHGIEQTWVTERDAKLFIRLIEMMFEARTRHGNVKIYIDGNDKFTLEIAQRNLTAALEDLKSVRPEEKSAS